MGMSACGNKKSMESGQSDEEVGKVHQGGNGDGVTRLEGEEEGTAKARLSEDQNSPEAVAARERAEAKAAKLPSGSTRSGEGKSRKITVKAGEPLWKIAERKEVYGSGWLYPLIYKANKNVIKDPNHIPAGTVLVVPRDVADPEVEMAKEEAMTNQVLDTTPLQAAKPAKPAPVAEAPKAPKKHRLGWIVFLGVLAGAAGGAWVRLLKSGTAAA